MKNIHIIPTNPNDETCGGIWIKKTRDWCNIYITNDEKIKERDYATDGKNIVIWSNDFIDTYKAYKKIILTTDKDLIKDGIQAIDDEFLEWFIKNPSCEKVDVELIEDSENHPELVGNPREEWSYYKIIIPKEEPKKIYEIPLAVNNTTKSCTAKPKQETLEEAAKEYSELIPFVNELITDNSRLDFEAGAKWQQERMHSDEEVLRIIKECKRYLSFGDEFDEIKWFEQFKKK